MTNQQTFSLCFFCLPVIPQDDESLARLVPLLILNFVLFSFLIALLFFRRHAASIIPQLSPKQRGTDLQTRMAFEWQKWQNVAMQTLACVAGVKIWARESVWGGECVVPLLPRARSRALIPFPFPFERLPRRLCNHINCCSLPHLIQYTTSRTRY